MSLCKAQIYLDICGLFPYNIIILIIFFQCILNKFPSCLLLTILSLKNHYKLLYLLKKSLYRTPKICSSYFAYHHWVDDVRPAIIKITILNSNSWYGCYKVCPSIHTSVCLSLFPVYVLYF